MNKTAIKNFAIWSRKKLMDDVRIRAELIGITEEGIKSPLPQSTDGIQYFDVGTSDPYSITGSDIFKRERIVSRMQNREHGQDYATAYRNLLEHTASTWFNRLSAIRFMEVNDYFDDGLRVLSSIEEGKQDSDLMSNPFDSDLEFSENERQEIIDWKLNNSNEELFRKLLLKKCKKLSEILPGLFNSDDDPTELLMSFSIADKNGFVWHLTHDVDEEDWLEQVEIIGWLYQFYNTEFKDETYTLLKKDKKALTKERIPSITQLFTPEWIVRYMVENSLGRIWIEGHPDSTLKSNWKYYLEEAEQEPEVEEQLKKIRVEYSGLNPEELSFIDPCMGSGHILAYAFDVLMQIYEANGYVARDAVKSIIENNLYGLDVDDRAYQLAYFSIMMKARQYDRGAFRRGYAPRIYAIEESNGITKDQIQFFGSELGEMERNSAVAQMVELVKTFKDAKEYGSILKSSEMDWKLLHRFLDSFDSYGSIEALVLNFDELQKRLRTIINSAELLSRRYWVTCTNPPYMAPTHIQKEYVEKHYKDGKTDLCAVFILRLLELTHDTGLESMITMHSWMFLSSYEDLRKQIVRKTIINMAHLGARAFEEIGGEVVQTTAFITLNRNIQEYKGTFRRLVNGKNQQEKEILYLSNQEVYQAKQKKFSKIPGTPVAYWISTEIENAFEIGHPTTDYIDTFLGIITGDNDLFLRLWYELDIQSVGLHATSMDEFDSKKKYWIPYNKGGEFRRWYGIQDYVINWKNGPTDKRRGKKDYSEYYLREYVAWSYTVSTSAKTIATRYYPPGFLWDVRGSGIFDRSGNLYYLAALISSKVGYSLFRVNSEVLSCQVENIVELPVIIDSSYKEEIEIKVKQNIDISKTDWDSFETSWDYAKHPLVGNITHGKYNSDAANSKISDCYMKWEQSCTARFEQLKANEEALNRIFIDIYRLQKELTPDVTNEDVTVRKADMKRDVKSFISYAVGCMLGRYSLDVEGLAYAGGDWDSSMYSSFIPDDDNCIPITDEDYFQDDIVGRFVEFVKTVYGDETLEENLKFIADAIGGNGEPREVIRKYFLNDFFKDHCQTYSVTGSGKRPIYWLFDSGKQNGFKALVYMHRWSSDTIATVRAKYVTKVQEKYENELRAIDLQLEHLTDPRQKASLQRRKEHIEKQVSEIKEYDEIISHIALDHINIDLDDGVKVNHEKVQHDRSGRKYNILAPIK